MVCTWIYYSQSSTLIQDLSTTLDENVFQASTPLVVFRVEVWNIKYDLSAHKVYSACSSQKIQEVSYLELEFLPSFSCPLRLWLCSYRAVCRVSSVLQWLPILC